jgi:hypothetical protein
MRKFSLSIGIVVVGAVVLLLVGIGCTPVTSQEVTRTVAYPDYLGVTPAVEPIPAEGTRPYPSLENRRLEALSPSPEIDEPGYPNPEEGSGVGVIGEVPQELLDEIIAGLAARVGVERAAVRVIRAEQVVWPDGSLGCPQPGMVYTQALVDGYHVVLEHGGKSYDYRATSSGSFFLCENSLNLGTPVEGGVPID